MKTIIGIDHFFIAFFEKIAHWLQDWTGKNNFWFARIVIFAYLAIVIISSQFMLKDKDTAFLSPLSFVVGILVAFMFLIFSYMIEQRTSQHSKFKNSFSNPYFDAALLRITLIVFFMIDIPLNLRDGFISTFEIYEGMRDVTYLTIWYLLCVTPKPPSDSKIKKILKSLFQKREVATVSN